MSTNPQEIDNGINKAKILDRFKTDRFATEVTGIEIVDVALNYAKVKLEVGSRHFNAVGIVQGGVLFTLADFAFAVASNAGAESETVGIECTMSYFKPTQSGTLYAEATLLSRSRSLQSFDVPVTNEKGDLVAKFYGRGFVRVPR